MIIFYLQTAELSPVASVDSKSLAGAEKEKFKDDWLYGWKVDVAETAPFRHVDNRKHPGCGAHRL